MGLEVYSCRTYPFEELCDVRPARSGPGRRRSGSSRYANVLATFDIETTNMHEIKQSFMWHWQACIEGKVIVGRTWEEFSEFLERIHESLPEGLCFVWYVHNLAFEFEYLRAIHHFDERPLRPGVDSEVFCVTGRQVVRALIGERFEFRCSYFLTNMSLREFLKKMNIEHQKTEMDYDEIRYPWSPVSDEDLAYCIADVLGLYEALKVMLAADHHTLASVPMSSTGYVRADFKRAMRRDPDALAVVRSCAPTYNAYLHLRRAFRGGNTHCNRCYTGVILDHVSSYDRASSYPDVLVNMPYPVKPFYIDLKVKRLSDLWDRTPYVLFVQFEEIELQDPFEGCPYIPVHKCQTLSGEINDNGRVIKAKRLSIYITDIDYMIIKDMYQWKSDKVISCYRSEYGRLPQPMIDVTMEYYQKKTELKGVDGQEVYYTKSKNKLNSIYGMCATNPVRTTLRFNGKEFVPLEDNEEILLERANKRAFTVYAWGCWCTAWARYWLQRAIDLCGHQFVYCDTDSVKFIGDVDLSELNDEIRELSERHAAYADDPSGCRHYLGVYELDTKEPYKKFCSLGAKKYAYEDDKGLHITIAGVSKSGAEEMQTINNFREGFLFTKAGGMEATYNDEDDNGTLEIDGHEIKLTPNIYLEQSTYRLGITMEYKHLFRLTQEQYDKYLKTR
jgi:hypothetical protein